MLIDESPVGQQVGLWTEQVDRSVEMVARRGELTAIEGQRGTVCPDRSERWVKLKSGRVRVFGYLQMACAMEEDGV